MKTKLGIEDKKTVLFAGRLTEQKGVQYLLHAIPKIRRVVADVKFLIVGDGPIEDFLRSEAKRLGVDSDVIFLGRITHDLMPEFYSMADVFVLPSLSESFPNTMLEAMAMEKPAVMTRVGVAPEILENYETAVLVQPAEPEELADALVDLLSNETLSRKLGRSACELVHREYSWDHVVDQTLDLYEEVLS